MPLPMRYREFSATDDEMRLASRLLEQNNWSRADSLSFDSAIGIFGRSGLSPKQLHDIWSIADSTGSGNLSREELAVAIRLIGCAQVGEAIHEGLLSKTCPLPMLKGFTDKAQRKIDTPLLTPIEHIFDNCNAADGISEMKAVYSTTSTPALDHVNKITKLIESNYPDKVPSSVLLEPCNALRSEVSDGDHPWIKRAQPHPSLPSSSSTSPLLFLNRNTRSPELDEHTDLSDDLQFSGEIEFDLQKFIADIEKTGGVNGNVACNFASEYKVPIVDLIQLWHETDIHGDDVPTPTRLSQFRRLILRKLAEKITSSGSHSNLISLPVPRIMTHLFSESMLREDNDGDASPPVNDTTQDLSSISEPSTYTVTVTPSSSHTIPLSEAKFLSSIADEDILMEFQRETFRISLLAQKIIAAESMNQNRLKRVDELQDHNNRLIFQLSEKERKVFELSSQNDRLKQQEQDLVREIRRLQTELITNSDISEKTISTLKGEIQGTVVTARKNTDDSQRTVDIQDSQIAEPTGPWKDTGQAILDALPHSESPHKHDLRMLFLRASLDKSRAMTTNALRESDDLRQTIATQSEENTVLRGEILRLEQASTVQSSKDDWPFFHHVPGPIKDHSHRDDDSTDDHSFSPFSELSTPLADVRVEPFITSLSPMDSLRNANENLRWRNHHLKSEFQKLERNTNFQMRSSRERLTQEIGRLRGRLENSVTECTSLRQWELEQSERLRQSQAETARVQEEADHLGRLLDSQTKAAFRLRAQISNSDPKVKSQTPLTTSFSCSGWVPGTTVCKKSTFVRSQNLGAK